MRPEKLHRELNNAIKLWKQGKDSSVFYKLLPSMNKQWKKWANEEEDFRTGHETYGYKNTDSIANTMMYISDRWRCAFRLKWLIDGVESGSI